MKKTTTGYTSTIIKMRNTYHYIQKNSTRLFYVSIVEIFSMYEDILEKRISEKVYNFKQLINISLKRRIFSPIILIGDLKNLCERELQIIYEQMEINFIYKLFSHLISDQDLTLLSCIIYEFIIRYNPEKKKEIESNSDFPRKFLTVKHSNNIRRIT